MPHLTLEFTENLRDTPPTPELMLSLHRVLGEVAGIKIENCKSRWRLVEDWVVAGGAPEGAFVHLALRFLEGRTETVIAAVGNATLEVLKRHFSPAPEGIDLQITVEVEEIRKAAYFKDPPGTLGTPPPMRLV
jgi:5-carboxymethyl-2-hydroxymuconate isomerase